MSLNENWYTDVYRIDKNCGSFVWLERILINEGEVYYTEDYRSVSKKEFRRMKKQGRIEIEAGNKKMMRKVFLIYYQYITWPYYYASNTEWVFDPHKAELFGSKKRAGYHLERLVKREVETLKSLGINPDDLMIESRNMLVSDHLYIEG